MYSLSTASPFLRREPTCNRRRIEYTSEHPAYNRLAKLLEYGVALTLWHIRRPRHHIQHLQ